MKKNLWISILLMGGLSSSVYADEPIISPYVGDGTPGFDYMRLNTPSDVCVGKTNSLYIADTVNNAIRAPTGYFYDIYYAQFMSLVTLVGTGEAGFSGDGGNAKLAKLNHPMGIAIDSKNRLYIADQYNHRIRKVESVEGSLFSESLTIYTIAGNSEAGIRGDHGFAKDASLNRPSDVAVDAKDNLYIADEGNNVIRKIDGMTGIITTVAGTNDGQGGGFSGDGGPAIFAQLKRPTGVVVDKDGNLYIADNDNQVIRKVEASNGIIRTLGGTPLQAGFSGDGGPATMAKFNAPVKLEIDYTGHYLYVSDYWNHRIRKIDMKDGKNIISTLAGSTVGNSGDKGLAKNAQLNGPVGLAINGYSNDPIVASSLSVVDSLNHRIRVISNAVPLEYDLEHCGSNHCLYENIFLERTYGGRYIFSINLAPHSQEGMFGLTITTQYPFGGYTAGAVLKDRGETPSFAQIYLSEPASFAIALAEYTGVVNDMTLVVKKQDQFGFLQQIVYAPTENAYNKIHHTPQLEGGYWYTVTVNSQYFESNRGQVGFTVTGSDFPEGITLGGWIDGKTGSTGEGFAAFTNPQSQSVRFDLLFGDNYSTVGAGPLVLDICYQDDTTGKRTYYWSNQIDGIYSCIQ